MTGHRSIYPYQLLAIKKSHHLQVELGAEMENVHAKYDGTINESLSRVCGYATKVVASLSIKRKTGIRYCVFNQSLFIIEKGCFR
jgi:hypothetical protein